MQMYHSGVDTFVISRLAREHPISKRQLSWIDRSRTSLRLRGAERAFCPERLMLRFVTFTGPYVRCLHVGFECFKLALWPTLRQKFMSF